MQGTRGAGPLFIYKKGDESDESVRNWRIGIGNGSSNHPDCKLVNLITAIQSLILRIDEMQLEIEANKLVVKTIDDRLASMDLRITKIETLLEERK